MEGHANVILHEKVSPLSRVVYAQALEGPGEEVQLGQVDLGWKVGKSMYSCMIHLAELTLG